MFEKYKIIITVEGSNLEDLGRLLHDLSLDILLEPFRKSQKFTREMEEAKLKGKYMILEDSK